VISICLLVVLCVSLVVAYPDRFYGIDVSDAVSQSQFACLLQQNLSFAIVRVFRSTGQVDPNAVQTIANAHAAGVRVDGYIFPCAKCSTSGSTQIATLMKHLNSSKSQIGTLWFDIEQAGTYWSSDHASNQRFLEDMISECNNLGVSFGVYSNWVSWPSVFGNSYAFPGTNLPPLWYPHYDGKPTYSDFKPFGGFTASAISLKQFSDKGQKCSASYDINWRPTE
jgi:hypothetical protein